MARVGLALGGGGTRGPAHAGVLRVLRAHPQTMPSVVAGTSAGSIAAAVYAVGVSQEQTETAFADAMARFDPMVRRHHHATCRLCGQLIDLEPDIVPDIPLPKTEGLGFEITDYSINFTGICSRCQS